ncbi:MAG TPA: serine protease [Candidatus Eremiobacteraceae bacterium]|nr:serine protease [Candidatus Eremiobacteraceae bacterium]
MRSARVGIVAILIASASSTVFAPTPSLASPIDTTNADETVIVYAARGAVTNIGAGVIVGQQGGALVIATAAHVIANAIPRVQLDSGAMLNVVEIDRIEGFDLAVLKTSAYDGRPSLAAFGQPSPGEDVHVWGHRLTQRYVESQASVSDLDPTLPEGPADGRFGIDCESCDHGDSGAGVFDARGRLLGILEGARRDQFGDIVFVECEPIAPIETALATAASSKSGRQRSSRRRV